MLRKYLRALKDIIFPPLCLCCQVKINEGYLCRHCLKKIRFLGPYLCQYCSLPINYQSGRICPRCKDKIPPFTRVISIAAYQEPMVSLIHLFKYKNCEYLAGFLSNLIVRQLLKIKVNFYGFDAVLSVPMHKYKLKMRGYNQSKLLAKLLSKHFKIPLRDDIISNKTTNTSQTKLSKDKRQKNVEGAFTARGNLENKNLILVDDIFTTGSTINACAKALKEKGANKILVVTLAKTLN